MKLTSTMLFLTLAIVPFGSARATGNDDVDEETKAQVRASR